MGQSLQVCKSAAIFANGTCGMTHVLRPIVERLEYDLCSDKVETS